MSLIGLDEIGNRKKRRQEKRKANKEKRKKKREERGGSRAKKFFLAPARAAFFLLMKVNFLQLRKKLRQGWKKDKNMIETKIIKKFGFKRNNFLRELNRKESEKLSAYLGTEPATAVAVAQSTPILLQVSAVLSSLGVAAGAVAAATDNLKGSAKELSETFKKGVADNLENMPLEDRLKGGGQSADDYSEKPTTSGTGSGTESPTTGKMNPLILLGGGALVLFLLTKKK